MSNNGYMDSAGFIWPNLSGMPLGRSDLVDVCSICGYMGGGHSTVCVYSLSYSTKLTNLTARGESKMASGYNGNNGSLVIEVVLLGEDEDGNIKLLFGPRPFVAGTGNAAIAKATGEFVGGGGDAAEVTNALTRFFG